MKKCSTTKIIEIILTVMIAFFAVITVLRSFYTVDITDESFIYAETLLMLKGNVPYAINATDVSGMCFLILPFAYIYKLLVPSLSGIVLFLRLSFSILRLLIVFLTYRIIRKNNEKLPSLLVALLLTVWYYFTNYFSYNSNSVWILILVSVWLYDLHDKTCKKNYIKLFFAGSLSAFAVFSHPFATIPIVLFAILLLVFSETGNKVKNTLFYCAGGLTVAFSILFIIVVKTSFFKFYSGLRILSLVIKQSESFSKIYAWIRFFDKYKYLYLIILVSFAISYLIFRKRESQNPIGLALSISVALGTIFCLITFLVTGFDLKIVGCYFGSMGILLSIMIGIAKKEKMILFTSLPFFLFLVMELSGQRNGGEILHPSLAVPTLIAVVLTVYKDASKYARWILGVAIVLISMQLIYADVVFSYRDDPITSLDAMVESGVYKGIITSKMRAICLPEMENWIDEETKDCDSVIFRDNAPFGYLMYKGHTPELQSWDMLNYSAGWKKNAKIMYNNYKNRGEFPKRIIYVDYGRDECLSIETDYEFNDWVNSYYDFVKEEKVNEMFRVKIYDYNGTFDGDYSRWTNF